MHAFRAAGGAAAAASNSQQQQLQQAEERARIACANLEKAMANVAAERDAAQALSKAALEDAKGGREGGGRLRGEEEGGRRGGREEGRGGLSTPS